MTNDYRIVVPLMVAAILSFLIAQRLEPDSVYTQRLRKRGIDLRTRRDADLMRSILVRDAMEPPGRLGTVPENMPIDDLAARFSKTGHHGFPVVDERGELVGMVALQDLERAVQTGQVKGTVRDICTRSVITAYPDESLQDVLGRMGTHEVGRIPVVERRHPARLVGILRRSGILSAYARALTAKTDQERRRERLRLEGITGVRFVEIDVAEGDPAVGKEIKDLHLPSDVVLVSIRRGSRVVIPHGDTVVLPADRLLAEVLSEHVDELKLIFKG
jgi:CIC family chloride channel protein